jgi:diguanylate cyclase (GGDEF)-like protein
LSTNATTATASGRQLSLRRLGVWLPVAVAVVIVGATLFIVAISLTVIGLAERGGVDSAPRQMEELRAVGNLERLIALGDQFAAEQDAQRWRSAGLTMQALAFHPSIAALASGNAQVGLTHQTVAEIMSLREEEAALTEASPARLQLAERRRLLWERQRALLKSVADDTAAQMVTRTTGTAQDISRSARLILSTTVVGALVGVAVCIFLLYLLRVYFLSQLLGVADYLSALRRTPEPDTALPRPNSQEMAAIVGAAADLGDAQRALEVMALHDRLTGLANRYALEARLEQSMASARRHGKRLAVLFMDLDQFKSINDSLGHDSGDELLKAVSQRLTACVREADTLARLGGDEFILVLSDIDEPGSAAAQAQKLIDTIERPILVEGRELKTSASVGISIFPDDGRERGVLMKNADIAMYHAKSAGRGNYQFFNASMNEAVTERLRLEMALRQALEKREFLLHYQPQLDLRSGRIVGVEALIRWRGPDGQLVPPATFIPLAEQSGLIVQIGEWVLLSACETLHGWRQQGLGDVQMGVNLSARQLRQADLAGQVSRLLERFQLPAHLLELEITESAAMDDPEATIRNLRNLKDLGVRLAIDDFGTGYSSLAYLKLFPIDRLKLDRTFVKDIETDPNDAAICAATIGLAHVLNLELIAEGVETGAQLAFLQQMGCDAMQGYLCSRPVPRETAASLIGRPCPAAASLPH